MIRLRSLLVLTLITMAGFASLAFTRPAEAHRNGCHRWHSCPSDTGSYVCGDLGYYTYCPNKPNDTPPPPAAAPAPPPQQIAPPLPPLSGRPVVDWRTYETDRAIQSYWQANGGLPVFGLAKTPLYNEAGHAAQIFERNRLEIHPENVAPYNVQLGLLGEERLIQIRRIWQNEPKGTSQPGCRYFAETGHNLCEPFLSYWRGHGLEFDGRTGKSEAESLALFGYPVSEAVSEVGSDRVMRPTQWLQRARFEDHGAEGGVLLGLLGNEVYTQK
jgi:hypothetical protein